MKVLGNENGTVIPETFHLSARFGGQQVLPAQQEHMDIQTATLTVVSGPLWHAHNMVPAMSVLGYKFNGKLIQGVSVLSLYNHLHTSNQCQFLTYIAMYTHPC